MLSDYGIENAGTKIEDKEQDLIKIECPFIAHKSGDFVVVYKVEPEKVHYFMELKITIFTNPYCNPCARMHKKVIKLFHNTKRNICVQYIFGSFGSEWDFANKNLIAAYLEKTQTEFERIISEWFEKGKPLKEAFFSDLQLDINSMEVEIENYNHEEWKEKTKLAATPAVLVNGYKLPVNYKIEDLRYFTEFDVNIK